MTNTTVTRDPESAPETATSAPAATEVRLDRFGAAIARISHRARSAELLTLLVIPGTLLLLIGFVAILLGWYGASQTVVQQAQLSYLISGGILGLALVITGALLLATAVWTTQLDRMERRVIDRVERLTSAQSAQAPEPPAPVARATRSGTSPRANGRSARKGASEQR
jgi:hypothetical protein